MNNVLSLDGGYDKALAILRDGGLVAVPTETVYGLAAHACDEKAVQNIYKAKGRPSFNPLIAHVADVVMAKRYAEFDNVSEKLAQNFWPGALTLVLPLKTPSKIAGAVTAGLDTIALRHPRGIMARLAAGLKAPLAAPSANSSGKISPTSAEHVADDLGNKVDLILDGGRCDVGLESTIVKCAKDGVYLLREGGIPLDAIKDVVGTDILKVDGTKLEAPGMMLAHYAPTSPLRLNIAEPREDEAFLAFGEGGKRNAPTRNLSPTGNLEEAAHNLFAMMKELDASHPGTIAVHPIPEMGIGAAINDRLRRAAHGNSA